MQKILSALQSQRAYFNSGATKTYVFRKAQLEKLKAAVLSHEKEIAEALYKDLKKKPRRMLGYGNRFFNSRNQ